MSQLRTIWTIGHSNLELERLFDLLAAVQIDTLVDVRSAPYSKYVPQANREVLSAACAQRGVQYVYAGQALGGRPREQTCFLPNGQPDYDAMRRALAFGDAIKQLREESRRHRLCLLCSEEDPACCHRALLVASALAEAGHPIQHLRHNGPSETQEELERRRTGGQLSFF